MILIVGATGELGGAITRMLLAQGRDVRALVREGSNFMPLADAGVKLVWGDLKQPTSLHAACQGVQTVITTANSARRGAADNPQTVDLEGNLSLIEAARANGVNHFILVSALIADASSPVPFLAAKGQAEQALKSSGMSYTILAPDSFMEYWIANIVGSPALSGKPVPIVGSGLRRHSFISAMDVARFAVVAVDHPAARNQKLFLGGPQPISYQEVAQVFERVLGRQVQIQKFQPGEPVPGLSPGIVGLLAAMESFDSPVAMEETAKTYAVRLTSVEEFAQSMANRGQD